MSTSSGDSKVLSQFRKELHKLGGFPNKNYINSITLQAKEMIRTGREKPETIANVLHNEILRAIPANKVPLWFASDSICYNVKYNISRFFEKNLPVILKDSFREVGEKDKQRLRVLLHKWKKRNMFTKDILDEAEARLLPGFNPEEYRRNVERRKAAESQAMHKENLTRPEPIMIPDQHMVVPTSSVGLPPPKEYYSESKFLQIVKHTAMNDLALMQQDVPEVKRYTLDEVKIHRKPLWDDIMEHAIKKLQKQGIYCENEKFHRTNSFEAARSPAKGLMFEPTEVNWSREFIRSGSNVESVAASLFRLGSSEDELQQQYDEFTGLVFAHKEAYATFIEKQKKQLKDGFLIREAAHVGSYRSRNYFINFKSWTSSWKSGQDVRISVSRDAEDGMFEEKTQEEVERDYESYTVPVDEDQPTCAMTGARFERYYDDKNDIWVYKSAIKDEATGKIYLVKPYFESKAQENSSPNKRKMLEESSSEESKKPRLVQ
eukprot:maker-scaffold_11-snap-gene-7.3-mRNA-1 protein AED:0.02 eAED:0.02 QI:78/1/1/1/1/1/4/125/489